VSVVRSRVREQQVLLISHRPDFAYLKRGAGQISTVPWVIPAVCPSYLTNSDSASQKQSSLAFVGDDFVSSLLAIRVVIALVRCHRRCS
jgi:hypothetical protein